MADEKGRADQAGGLARTISVVGLAISQAADELQQAAERLIAAEEQARDAELRTQAAEEQVAQSASRIAELLSMVEAAREQAAESDERARRAEAQLQAVVEQARELEQQTRAMEQRVRELEADAARVAELEEHLGELRARLEQAEARPTVIVDDEHTALKEAIAAEVRRPLTSILGITLALKHTDSKSPDGREMISQLATHARKLDRLVGETLEIDRIAAGTYVPILRRTDLEALVRRAAEESSDLANRDVEIRTDHVAIHVDPGRTRQMVETLLANAGRSACSSPTARRSGTVSPDRGRGRTPPHPRASSTSGPSPSRGRCASRSIRGTCRSRRPANAAARGRSRRAGSGSCPRRSG